MKALRISPVQVSNVSNFWLKNIETFSRGNILTAASIPIRQLVREAARQMASAYMALPVNFSVNRPSVPHGFDKFKTTLHTVFQPLMKELQQLPEVINVRKFIKDSSVKLLDVFVDSVFEFADQPLHPSQNNLVPVDGLKEPIVVTSIEGKIPDDFPKGVYIRNGPNPIFGGLKSTKSIFGRSSYIWVEGEGMLHAIYFHKDSDGRWIVVYNNRQVETDTLMIEKQRHKPSFLPATEGDSPALVSAYLLNLLRFGKVNKDLSNTNVFEHAGKFYSITENYVPQEIDIFTLATLGNWDINGVWNRPFTSHPKKAPGTGELVMMGVDAIKPYVEVAVISADGKELVHRVDLKLNRCTLSHEIGVTQRYNVFLDFPLTVDLCRLVNGGPLIKYDKDGYARIGVFPRYGDANSIQWFDVEPNCTYHIFNCFEDEDEVVVWGCKTLDSIIPGPHKGLNKFEWFSRRLRPIAAADRKVDATPEDGLLFSRCYEWRLNMRTGGVKERFLTGSKYAMDFPMINAEFTGVKNKYGYAQLVDSIASSGSGMPKYGGLAKLYFKESGTSLGETIEDEIKVEYHKFEKNNFCSGAAFVPNEQCLEEDDGWIATFVHNEDTNISQVHIVDAKKFSGEPVAKITLPCRVPYGYHGAFMPIQTNSYMGITSFTSISRHSCVSSEAV